MKTAFHDDQYNDDVQFFDIIDGAGNKMSVHVGPVYIGNNELSERAIWIETDQQTFLLSRETFEALYRYTKRSFRRWRAWYKLKERIFPKQEHDCDRFSRTS